ncbi:hypothetical protein [Novosphingobium sp. AP12]|uniref:hypothetical protein n=1 Tax=Novosphingobium sp. AP12 TaxID=1144305 RepID=UPI0002720B05|nr:hypothetical protein [Novosphingobium sp. AP12]EJL23979.1 hypothetical protein PMI02_03899 [Novosphingobium sp. AP12]
MITRDVLEGMPGLNAPAPGEPQEFVHEIKITYADDLQDQLLIGEFIVGAGVNYL